MNIVRVINKPQILNVLDTPTFQRHAFGSLIITNMLLRPVATMADNSVSDQERRYSAAREFFQQIMCLVCHYTLATNFEKIGFHVARRFPKIQKEFGEYQTFQHINDARQFNVEARRNNRLILGQLKKGTLQAYKEMPAVLRGALKTGDSLGTITALALIVPILNNHLLGPILKACKLEAKSEAEEPPPLSDLDITL
jgi:hypothetical protein